MRTHEQIKQDLARSYKTLLSGKALLRYETEQLGLFVAEWSPGDGVTRYRFFDRQGNSYFGPDNGIYTALGLKEANTWLTGFAAGRRNQKGSS